MDTRKYPATPRHQALLQAIASYYEHDSRVLALSVFGSLSRGDWDEFSDLDLDVVLADGMQLVATEELHQLCEVLHEERCAAIVPSGQEAGDVLFESLMQMSVRDHTLETTNWKIVDSLQVLVGSIDTATVAAAGRTNRPTEKTAPRDLLDRLLRCVALVDTNLQRGCLWEAEESLHRTRQGFMELYCLARGGQRPEKFFQTDADDGWQHQLARTIPQHDHLSMQAALRQCIEILEQDLARLADGQAKLAGGHRVVLANIRTRQGWPTAT
jgi:predicted nucleotidyltransferase